MLTCTVSMIETAVAIITTCLPTLRVLILGHTSRKGTYPYASGHRSHAFELHTGTNNYSNHQTTITGGTHNETRRTTRPHPKTGRSDSEDELVKELHQYPAQPSPTLVVHPPMEARSFDGRISGDTCVSPKGNAIAITTEVTVLPEVTVTVLPEDAHSRDGQSSPSFKSMHEP